MMPISLRLSPDVEDQIAGFGARLGLSKSAVIVRSIQEFLTKHAEPSSFQIYEEVMQASDPGGRLGHCVAESGANALSPTKAQVRQALAAKHKARSARALQANSSKSA